MDESLRKWFLNSANRTKSFLGFIDHPISSATTIAKEMGVHPKTVSTYFQEFIEKGIIHRNQTEYSYKQEKLYELTEKGKELLNFSIKEKWFVTVKIEELNNLLYELKDFNINEIFDKLDSIKKRLENIELKDLHLILQKLELLKKIGDLNK